MWDWILFDLDLDLERLRKEETGKDNQSPAIRFHRVFCCRSFLSGCCRWLVESGFFFNLAEWFFFLAAVGLVFLDVGCWFGSRWLPEIPLLPVFLSCMRYVRIHACVVCLCVRDRCGRDKSGWLLSCET